MSVARCMVEKFEPLIFFITLIYCLLWGISLKGPRDLMIAAAILTVIIPLWKYQLPIIFDKNLAKFIFIFIGSYSITSAFTIHPFFSISRVLQLLPQFLPLLVIPYILKCERINKLVLAISFTTSIVAIYAIWQGVNGNLRANGFMDAAYVLAHHLVFYILFGICCTMKNEMLRVQRYAIILTVIVAVIALGFNGTRAAWIALIISIMICMIMVNNRRNPSKKMILFGGISILILFCGLFFIPQIEQRFLTLFDPHFESNSERILMWESAFHIFKDHLLIGIGFDNFFEYYHSYYISPLAQEIGIHRHPHNIILKSLCETGIVGCMSFLLIFIYSLKRSYILYRQTQNPFALASFLLIISFFIQGMFDFNFDQLSIMSYFWFLVGLGLYEGNQRLIE